jgi:hypothetical protein
MAGSKAKSSTTIKDKQAEEFKALRGPFADLLSGSMGDIGSLLSGNLTFGGSGFDVNNYRSNLQGPELDAFRALQEGYAGGPNDRLREDLVGRTLSGDFLSPENNPGLRDLIGYTNQGINDTFNSEDLAQRSLFARAGQVLPESSPFAQAQGDLASARLDAIGKNVAQITSGAYEAERGRQVQAVDQSRSDAEFEFSRQLEYLQATALPRLIDEVGFERGFQEFNNRVTVLAQALGLLGQVTAPALGTVGKTSSSGGGLSLTGASSSSGAAS